MGPDLTHITASDPADVYARPDGRPDPPPVLRVLPGLVAFLVAAGFLIHSGTPVLSLLLYTLGLVWQIMVPGILIHRAVAGRAPHLIVEVAMGSVIGLMVRLVGWFVLVGLGIGRLMVLWPLVVVVPFVLIDRLRPHLRLLAYPRHPAALTSWGLSAGLILASIWFTQVFRRTGLPPAANDWYQDLYYHLSLSGRFLHQVTPITPQVAGEPLVYHWFANAHMAASALATFQDMPLVLNRLFILPVVALTIAMFGALMHELTDRIWPAVVAVLLTVIGGGIRVSGWYGLHGTEPLALYSPSQIYSLPILLFSLTLLVRLLRGGRMSRLQWALLVLSLMMSAGAKSSSLPLLICGLLLALMVSVLRQGPVRPAVVGLLAAVAALVVTAPLLGGGGSGSGIQLFSTLRRNPLWASFVGLSNEQRLFPDGPILPGLDHPQGPGLLALVAAAYAVLYLWLLPGAAVMRGPDGARAALLLGVGIAGFAAMMLIDHDGMSQVYFMNQALVAWHALAAWGVWAVVSRAQRRLGREELLTLGIGSVLLGGLASWGLQAHGPSSPEPARYLELLAVPVLGTLVGTSAFLVAIGVARRRGRPSLAAALTVALSLGLMGAALLPRVDTRLEPASAIRLNDRHVTAAETEAAIWLRENTSPEDVVATNVHCLGLDQGTRCDARAFWLSGFSERQVLIEGWGYTDDAHLNHGRDGYPYANQPFRDQELFRLNEEAFSRPSEAVMTRLAALGVRWLFANTHRAEASPALGEVASEVFRTDDVVVYSLTAP